MVLDKISTHVLLTDLKDLLFDVPEARLDLSLLLPVTDDPSRLVSLKGSVS